MVHLFLLNQSFYSQQFYNALAHYKTGVYLKAYEIVSEDTMCGMTQKAFNCDFYQPKNEIMGEC